MRLMLIITFGVITLWRNSITAFKGFLREVDKGSELSDQGGNPLAAHVHTQRASSASQLGVRPGQPLAHPCLHPIHPGEADCHTGQVGGEKSFAELFSLLLSVQRPWSDQEAGCLFFYNSGVGGEAVEEKEDGKEASCQQSHPGGVEGEEEGGDEHQQMSS